MWEAEMDSSAAAAEARWEWLRPAEFRVRQAALPVVYLPLGTVEWHGEHNVLGLDALKAHALCVQAAQRAGGIVHPPLYGGMGGLDKPATVVMEDEYSWENYLLRPWLERLCSECCRQGFRAVVILTGHYGHNQQIVVRETAVRMSERLQVPVLGTAEYWLAQDVGYLGDHAGIGETSLMMHLFPGSALLERLASDPEYGLTDEIARGSSAELGERYAEAIVSRLAAVAGRMPAWDGGRIESFVAAERALVTAQVRGWGEREPWAAWVRTFTGEFTGYGQMLAEERFADIRLMADRLLE
jgi:creatinine amidohydrolase